MDREDKQVSKMWAAVGITPAFVKRMARNDERTSPARIALRNSLRNPGPPSIVLSNEYFHTGKLAAALHWLTEQIESDPKVVHVQPMIERSVEFCCDVLNNRRDRFDRLIRAPYLVLYDIGLDLGYKDPWIRAEIGSRMAARLETGLPTFITTLLSAPDAVEAYGATFWRSVKRNATWVEYASKAGPGATQSIRFDHTKSDGLWIEPVPPRLAVVGEAGC